MKRFLFKQLIDFRAAAGTSCQPRARLVVSSLAFIVAAVGTIGLTRAADELPSQDQALARALENHPDIVAAKAKVALVEAELYGKRMEVSRQVLGHYGGLKALDAQIEAAKASLNQSRADLKQTNKAVADGATDQSATEKLTAAVLVAEGKLVQAMAQREQVGKELRLLIGAAPRAKEEKLGIATATPARQTPQGPIASTWKAAAEAEIKLSFADTPLEEVLNFLSEKTGIKFSLQRQVLEAAGVDAAMATSLNTNDVPLRAALQGFEDTYPEMQFVLRDYGVLLTMKDYAKEHGYMPVLEIDNESAGVKRR